MKRILIGFCALMFYGGIVVAQSGVFTLDPKGANVTLNGPATGTFAYDLPAKNGTVAMTSDIAAQPASAEQRGKITLANGAGSVTFAPAFAAVPNCLCYDYSGNSTSVTSLTATALSVKGIGPTVVFSCR